MKISLKRSLLLAMAVAMVGSTPQAYAQYHRELIEKLCAPKLHGRGYYKNGDNKAAAFIQKEFKKAGAFPINGQYLQEFSFPVNTFPGKVEVELDQVKLQPGKDFIVNPGCPPINGRFPIKRVTIPFDAQSDWSKTFLHFDKMGLDSLAAITMDSLMKNPPTCAGILITQRDKTVWSVATKVAPRPVVRIQIDSLQWQPTEIDIHVESKFVNEHKAYNVAAYLPGTSNADSFIVFTAHYDHLGRMGPKALFAGANDNASGTAMIIDLARWFSKPENRPAKSVLFIAFAGEEAGLIGSKYYTESPMVRLDRIRFLLNLDLMGNGDEGMMVVNGELHTEEFYMLDRINKEKGYLKTLGKRGTAKNSDHYFFSEKGVPAFFFYTNGGSKAYHDVNDLPHQLPLTHKIYDQLFDVVEFGEG
ncbi:MAG: M28 family metallopeptidase [Bacteroidota bacterium]